LTGISCQIKKYSRQDRAAADWKDGVKATRPGQSILGCRLFVLLRCQENRRARSAAWAGSLGYPERESFCLALKYFKNMQNVV